MQVTVSAGAVRVTPSLRYLGKRLDKRTGEVLPAKVLDKWTKPCIVDRYSGELISRSEDQRRNGRKRDSDGREVWKTRGEARKFTTASVRNLRFASWQFPLEFMITLTYDVIPDVRKAKDDLNRYLTWLRSVGVTQYLWIAELQKRGALHYHIVIPNGKYCDLLRKRTKITVDGVVHYRPAACVAWGRCAHLPLRVWLSAGRFERVRSVEATRSYVRKYLSKGSSQEFVGRRWGSHRFGKTKIQNARIVRAFFRAKGWKQRDVIIGTTEDPITVAMLRQIYERIHDAEEHEKVLDPSADLDCRRLAGT